MKLSLQKLWHELFEVGVFIKGINGVWETISGFMILFLHKATLFRWLSVLTRKELLEDPHDKFISFSGHALQYFSSNTKTFVALYILAHGLLNLFLAIQLYRDKHWAYLVTIGTIIVFMFYQIYRITIYHSAVLTAITIFDALFILLAWHEYKYHRDRSSVNLSTGN